MKYIFPLPAISSSNLNMLNDIFRLCNRSMSFNKNKFKITNYFIDDQTNFDKIIKNIVTPLGIDTSEIYNLWNDIDTNYKCKGINFNVLGNNGYINNHVDTNPTKINILLSGKTNNKIYYADTGDTWDWKTPALIDVSKEHCVTNEVYESIPRVTMQIFLINSFEYYKNIINLNPEW